MRAIKIQTKAGREMSETGIIPRFVSLGQFWEDGKPLFETVNIDPDDLPEGTVLKINRETFDQNPLYLRKEPSNTGEPWAKLDRAEEEGGETHHYIERPMLSNQFECPMLSNQWMGFSYAAEIFIIYVPES